MLKAILITTIVIGLNLHAQQSSSKIIGPSIGASSSVDSSTTIFWFCSDSLNNCTLELGLNSGMLQKFPVTSERVDNNLYSFETTCKHLMPNSLYSYRIIYNNDTTAMFEFKSFPAHLERNISFVVIGDSQQDYLDNPNSSVAKRLAEAILINEKPSLVIHTGDLTSNGDHKDSVRNRLIWENEWFQTFKPLHSSCFIATALGNHDFTPGTFPKNYVNFLNLPKNAKADSRSELYYNFDFGSAHISGLCLKDSVLDKKGVAVDNLYDPQSTQNNYGPYTQTQTQQMAWFTQDTKRVQANNDRWLIAFAHRSMYSSGSESNHNGTELSWGGQATGYRDAIEECLVDCYFSGHSHCYLRFSPTINGQLAPTGNGTRYFVCGGATSLSREITAKDSGIETIVFQKQAIGINSYSTTELIPHRYNNKLDSLYAASALNYSSFARNFYLVVSINNDTCTVTTKYIDQLNNVHVYDHDHWKKRCASMVPITINMPKQATVVSPIPQWVSVGDTLQLEVVVENGYMFQDWVFIGNAVLLSENRVLITGAATITATVAPLTSTIHKISGLQTGVNANNPISIDLLGRTVQKKHSSSFLWDQSTHNPELYFNRKK